MAPSDFADLQNVPRGSSSRYLLLPYWVSLLHIQVYPYSCTSQTAIVARWECLGAPLGTGDVIALQRQSTCSSLQGEKQWNACFTSRPSVVCRQAGYLHRVIPCTGSNLNRTLGVLAIYFAVDAFTIAYSGTAANQRTSNKCESAGGSEAGSVPINGVCKARDSNEEVANVGCKKASANEVGDQACGKREGDTYFLYKGGCYSIGDATGQELYTEAAAGVCSAAASGYFAPTEAVNTEQSVVACKDEAGITIAVGGNNVYNGTANCLKCSPPTNQIGASIDQAAVRALCDQTNHLKEGACVADASVFGDGYAAKKDDTNGNKCLACTDQSSGGVTGCAKCTYDSSSARIQCTKCTTNYLKKKTDGSTECVAEDQCDVSGSAYYKVSDSNKGNKCVSRSDAAGKTWKGVKG